MTDAQAKKDMRAWLRTLRQYDPLAGIVLKRGRWFLGRANVADYAVTAKWKKKRKPQVHDCFYNAQEFCLDHPEFSYWEGYFLILGNPAHHAWIVMDDGCVVDFTLEAVLQEAKRQKIRADAIRAPLYYGVTVPADYILRQVLDTGVSDEIAELYYSHRRPRRQQTPTG